ncbi:MAG: NAD-dependent epimerase/dehydratase family protein [Lachnospiraceae bacterium]|nr:NAD-dependent epimerase/dehydratase family protein [Lachnospiraceae bacterium]
MKVIVTGACGFIGQTMAEYMANKGYDVTGWDVRVPDEAISGVTYRSVDMCSLAMTEENLKGHMPDIIIHCAGSASVSDSLANPDRDFELNVGITHNLLYAMHRQGLNRTRLVYLSSAGVYGNPAHLPIREDDEIHPISPYALHKSMCEDMCRYFTENHDFDIKIARIFSAYGAGLKKQIFWDMYHKYTDTGKLEMFGDGTESRDFINIEDLKQALYLIATSDYEEQVINVANGTEISIREVTDMFARKIGIPENLVKFNGIRRTGDPNNWKADISLLKELGYKQTVSMEAGISGYCDWVKTC